MRTLVNALHDLHCLQQSSFRQFPADIPVTYMYIHVVAAFDWVLDLGLVDPADFANQMLWRCGTHNDGLRVVGHGAHGSNGVARAPDDGERHNAVPQLVRR